MNADDDDLHHQSPGDRNAFEAQVQVRRLGYPIPPCLPIVLQFAPFAALHRHFDKRWMTSAASWPIAQAPLSAVRVSNVPQLR